MRLSDWRARAPAKEAVSSRLLGIVTTGLTTLGAEPDPECWIAWGDDPAVRYLVLAPTPAGLIQLNVRVNVSGEGPRASGKLIRWHRVQLGELGIELQGGHRLATFQIDTQVLTGADDIADRIAAFAQVLFTAVDARPTGGSARRTRTPSTASGRGAAQPGMDGQATGRRTAKPTRSDR
jgi:hypothetical protein